MTRLRTPRLKVCAAAVMAHAAPAAATGTYACAGPAGADVSVEMNVATAPVLKPNWVRIQVGREAWSSLAEDVGPKKVAVLQSFDDGRSLAVDLADPNFETILISIRIDRIVEGDSPQPGTLRVLGRSLHPITCQGP